MITCTNVLPNSRNGLNNRSSVCLSAKRGGKKSRETSKRLKKSLDYSAFSREQSEFSALTDQVPNVRPYMGETRIKSSSFIKGEGFSFFQAEFVTEGSPLSGSIDPNILDTTAIAVDSKKEDLTPSSDGGGTIPPVTPIGVTKEDNPSDSEDDDSSSQSDENGNLNLSPRNKELRRPTSLSNTEGKKNCIKRSLKDIRQILHEKLLIRSTNPIQFDLRNLSKQINRRLGISISDFFSLQDQGPGVKNNYYRFKPAELIEILIGNLVNCYSNSVLIKAKIIITSKENTNDPTKVHGYMSALYNLLYNNIKESCIEETIVSPINPVELNIQGGNNENKGSNIASYLSTKKPVITGYKGEINLPPILNPYESETFKVFEVLTAIADRTSILLSKARMRSLRNEWSRIKNEDFKTMINDTAIALSKDLMYFSRELSSYSGVQVLNNNGSKQTPNKSRDKKSK